MKYIYKHFFIPWLILALSLSVVQPGYGFTIGEERQVGEKLLYTVRSSFEVLDEPDLIQYLNALGTEVIDVAGVQFFDYNFFVVNNNDFNAFAAPSGLIFFHSGLVEKMASENELVSVLAHEIGHIAKRHISSRISKQKKISVATMGMVLASIALGGGAATEALLAGSLAAGQSASLHFSRLDEEEADLLAYQWMKDMQRDPHGQVQMLQTMRRIARYRRDMVPQYLLTHPNPEARLNYVQTLVSSDEKELEKYDRGNDFAFLRFKYRVMTMTRDSSFLRKYFAAISNSKRATEFEKIMAGYGLAQLNRSENNFDESLELLQTVTDFFGPKNNLRVDRGIIELESGYVDKAYTTLAAAHNTDRSNAYAAFALARVCVEKGLLDRAESLYKSVMYKMPDMAKVYFELGRINSARGKGAATKFYLGKYHLLRGNLKLAQRNMEIALESSELDEGLEKNAKEAIALIKRLKE